MCVGALVAAAAALEETLISGLCVGIPPLAVAWPRREFGRSEDMRCLLFEVGLLRSGPLLGTLSQLATKTRRYQDPTIAGVELAKN